MFDSRSTLLQRAPAFLVGLLVLKVTASAVLGYRNYFPPDFASDFLRGREAYFAGIYRCAFYTHIAAGPVSLVLGLILLNETFRNRLPQWHRSLGKAQICLVLFLLTPSGLWMAYYAETGACAATGFAALAVATALCTLFGWRSAVQRRFAEHRLWMWRCYLLLCSAVVLRVIGGLAVIMRVGSDWAYPLAAWASWLLPLTAFELQHVLNGQERRQTNASLARER